MSNPWDPEEGPSEKELWDELADASDARKQDIYMTLGQMSFDAKKWDEANNFFQLALDLAETLTLVREKYVALSWMARVHVDLKDWDRVMQIFTECEAMAFVDLEGSDLARLFRTKAFAMREQRHALEAIEAFTLAERYSREGGEPIWVALDIMNRAGIHSVLREFNTARDLLLANLVEARELGNMHLAADIQTNLGKVYIELGDFGAAIATLTDAVTCFEALDHAHAYLADARVAKATALGRVGRLGEANALLDIVDDSLPGWEYEIRTQSVLLRSELTIDAHEAATLRQKARALALNVGKHHFVNVVDVNIAVVMAETGDVIGAEQTLRAVIESAEKFDDQDIINEARVRLASILVDSARADEALSLLETMSITTFGDDTFGWQRFALVRSMALLLLGDIDEAEQAVAVIMNLERTWPNLPMIAEAYWVTSQIEERRHGRTATWEHMLSASVAMLLQTGNVELATDRSRDLIPESDAAVTIPRAPMLSPNELLTDINAESGE